MYNVMVSVVRMSNDEERLVADIDGDLKERVKADPRTIKEIVESSLEREFQTVENAAIKRRIDEKKQRITTLEREINDREAELAKEQDELERLESMLTRQESKENVKMSKAREALAKTPKEPTNPAIEKWASELNMTPQELLDEL